MTEINKKLTEKTISDFGTQWINFRENPGYYGSVDMFKDYVGPLLPAGFLTNKKVADIGSGTGRIVNMLLDSGAAHVTAVEPSEAYSVLLENTAQRKDQVTCLHGRGESLPPELDLDLAVSLGVLHHIPEPDPVVKAMYDALKPGGYALIWLYGHEGNELYLKIFNPLRRLTKKLPHFLLNLLSNILNIGLDIYIMLCRFIPLPMRDYVLNVLKPCSRYVRKTVIYDQLNPAYALYYKKSEAESLLTRSGFTDVTLWHRHGYSWTVLGKKPGVYAAGDELNEAK